MFTIKVTYRGQIRKHTFSDLNTFPSYDQISVQLYRVFSISQNFYLSKLLFSPDAAQSSRILIGKEVHSSYDYDKCVRQYKDRTWPHGLLRFNMCDETFVVSPRDLPSANTQPTPSLHTSALEQHLHFLSSSNHVSPFPLQTPVAPTLSYRRSPHFAPLPQSTERLRPTPQHRTSVPNLSACCSVAEGKAEVQAMLVNFQDDLNRVLENNLATPTNRGYTSLNSSRNNSLDRLTSAPPPALCSICTVHISASSKGPDSWYCCTNCHLVVCDGCHDQSKPGFCLSTMGSHVMKQAAVPLIGSTPLASAVPIPRLPAPWLPRQPHLTGSAPPLPDNHTDINPVAVTPAPSAPDPVVHGGIICDVCGNTVEGIRHKCLDCPDYDLCTSCINNGSATAHNPFHEFFEISEPGRVVVHTVFSGNGEREAATSGSRIPASASQASLASRPLVVHLATCDLCDSRIVGDRYKCARCPDFDTCSSCFSITNEQHPNHAFVRISKEDDYIRANSPPRQMHYANCDACSKKISGIRFKCMHPQCPDYDLCDKCEALPIPVHPQSHPMLKMKTADTIVPTVYRVGQTNLINIKQPIRQPEPCVVTVEKTVTTTTSPRLVSPPAFAPLTPVEEDRVKTPKPMPPLPPWMVVPSATHVEVPTVRVASPEKPPLPPKPEMISHPSWASIPSFYEPIVDMDPTYTPFFRPDNVHGYFSNPFADMPIPAPLAQVYNNAESSDDVHNAEKDISLPSVPKHIPNPWPATNPTERRELLQLIADFAGPQTSAKIISSLSDAPSRRSSRKESEASTPLLDLSVESLPTVSSKVSDKTSEEPKRQEFLPNVPVTPEFFNSLFQRIEDAAEKVRLAVDGPLTTPKAVEVTHSLKEIPSPEMKQADHTSPSMLTGFRDFHMSHLLERVEKLKIEDLDEISTPLPTKPASEIESSVSEEALLKRPAVPTFESLLRPYRFSLSDLINDSPTAVERQVSPEVVLETVSEKTQPEPLSAAFVEDVTVPDGQVFPPGAEFVKCWRLTNDGGHDWPESTELVFVAGESLSAEKATDSMTVELGKVVAGTDIDVWTGELKAPDAPGRYVGYWRLKADGELFGNSLWIEINVAEADAHHSSDESMSASSVIIMPNASSTSSTHHVPSTTVHTASVTASAPSTEDNLSDAGSDISLISVPSSPSDEEDDVLWHDSRSYTTEELAAAAAAAAAAHAARGSRPSSASATAMDYVLLYDDNSSSEASEE